MTEVDAAEFEILRGPFHNDAREFARVSLNGSIQPGDSNRLKELFTKELPDYFPDSSYVSIYMNSEGGSFTEALNLIDTFSDLRISTFIENGAICFSACALAFMGGSGIVANEFRVLRSIEPGGKLGFHAPSLALPKSGVVPTELLQSSYATALEAISGVFERRESHGIQSSLIQKMIATPPSEIYVLETVDDFARWQIDVEMNEDKWIPDTRDIARICTQYDAWLNGQSIFEIEQNSARQNAPDMQQHVSEWEKKVHFYEPPGRTGIRSVYAYASDQGMTISTCVVKLTHFRGIWFPVVFSSNSPPEVAIEAAMQSDGGGYRVKMLHALPYDFKIENLR